MSRYGIDYYGNSFYGASSLISFDATPFTAIGSNYGEITLDWLSPAGSWAKIRLVRNSYGFPITPFDGVTLLSVFKNSDPTSYVDTSGLSEGAFYYYSIFVFETTQYSWIRAGDAIGLSVKNHGNNVRMYSYLPEVMKVEKVYTVDTNLNNPALSSVLNLFGFQLDYFQTLTDLLIQRYDLEKVGGALLPSMLKQFGLEYEPEIGFQQSRILVRDAIQLYKEKGSLQGLREYVKAFSGFAVPAVFDVPNPTIDGITTSHNLMLDYNDSSFEESIGHWESISNASMSVLKKTNITKVSLTSNVATLTIGAHQYKVGNQIYIQNMALPLFSSPSTAKTLTAVTATTISYSLTAANISERNETGLVVPVPEPYAETTAPLFFPNKQVGFLSVTNTSASSATVEVACGLSNPITKGIPVNSGNAYTFSVYSTAGSTVRTITPKIRWYNRFGVLLSTTNGSAVANTTTAWATRLIATGTAPSNAYYAVPGVSIAAVAAASSNEHHYFDGAQFEQASSVTDFDEARQIHITIRATRINELLNPHFKSPFAPWSATGAIPAIDITTPEPNTDIYIVINKSVTSNVATIEVDNAHILEVGQTVVVAGVGLPFDGSFTITAKTGTSFSYSLTTADVAITAASGNAFVGGDSLRLTATGSIVQLKSTTSSADLMPIHYPETPYTFSYYIMTDIGPEYVTPSIHWYDDTKTLISTDTGSPEEVLTSWLRHDITGTAPAEAAYAHVQVDWNVDVSNLIQLDSAMFENSPFVLEYFDGNGGPGYSSDFLWEGSVGAARSHFYKNRLSIQLRIVEYLKEVLTLGSTAAIYLGQANT
jgi:P2-related tail formation protein